MLNNMVAQGCANAAYPAAAPPSYYEAGDCCSEACSPPHVADSSSLHDRPSKGRKLLATVKGTKKRVLIQRHVLVVFYHAVQCREPGTCVFSNTCRSAQELLKHTHTCRATPGTCTHPRCECTKRLLAHHRACRSQTCPVCIPVRRTVRKQRQRADQDMQPLEKHTAPEISVQSVPCAAVPVVQHYQPQHAQRAALSHPPVQTGAYAQSSHAQGMYPMQGQQQQPPMQFVQLQECQQSSAASGMPYAPSQAACSASQEGYSSAGQFGTQAYAQAHDMHYGPGTPELPSEEDESLAGSSDEEGSASPSSSILAIMKQVQGAQQPVSTSAGCGLGAAAKQAQRMQQAQQPRRFLGAQGDAAVASHIMHSMGMAAPQFVSVSQHAALC